MSNFTLLLSSGRYEWCTVLNIPNIDGVQVLKLNNEIRSCLLYSLLKRVYFHDSIFILIPITCLIALLDRGKWQYTTFRVRITGISKLTFQNV